MPTITNAAIVTVSDTESLRDAYNILSRSGGGTIEVSQGSRPIEIALSGGGQDHVNIRSANETAPTLLHRLSFDKVENVTVSDFRIDSSDVSRPDWHKDLMVSGGKNIVIEDSEFSSNAVGRYSPGQAGTVLGETLSLVRNTRDFSFEGNTVEDYYQGLVVFESIGTTIKGNEFSGLQGDGLRLAGVQQTEVVGNDMHNFSGTTSNFNHNDFIQVWSTNTKLLTKDLTITRNTLDAGDGASAQGIFIGNERFSRGERDHRYQNIEISDNIVHSGYTNGIAIFGANNVDVDNNSVLWNKISKFVDDIGDSGTSRAPHIRFTNVTDGVITDNIAPGFLPGGASVFTGNKTLHYSQSNNPNYVDANFFDVIRGGAGLDFNLRPDSDWDGIAGAPQTWSKNATSPVVTPPESEESLEPDITPEPETPSAPEVEETPEDDLPPVSPSPSPSTYFGFIIADTDFETTEANSVLSRFDSRALIQSGGDTSYQIGKGHVLQLDRSTDGLHGLEAFSLEMDVMADTSDLSGELLHFHKAFEVTTDRGGSLRFTLETDEGKFSVATDGNPLADGEEHRLGVIYDDDLGKISVRVDDQVVAEGEASGVTADGSYWGLTVGHTWSERGADTFDMLVDEFFLRTRVSDGQTNVPTEPLPIPEVQDPSQDEDLGEPSDPITEPNAGEFEIFL